MSKIKIYKREKNNLIILTLDSFLISHDIFGIEFEFGKPNRKPLSRISNVYNNDNRKAKEFSGWSLWLFDKSKCNPIYKIYEELKRISVITKKSSSLTLVAKELLKEFEKEKLLMSIVKNCK